MLHFWMLLKPGSGSFNHEKKEFLRNGSTKKLKFNISKLTLLKSTNPNRKILARFLHPQGHLSLNQMLNLNFSIYFP